MDELPSWEWREAFVEHAKVDAYGVLVGLVVSLSADVRTGEHAHPGLAAIVERTHIRDKRTIRDRLRQLENAGWLTVTHPGGSPKSGRRMAREWTLTVPPLVASDVTSRPGTRDETGHHGPGTSDARTRYTRRARPGAPDDTPPLPSPAQHPSSRCAECDDIGTVNHDGQEIACPARCSNVPPWARRVS